ncbi:MAG: hypothetical protein LBU66_03035 [Treponema sp.]|jgi:hypothetical protein|nr:hypothetical protein [Treponema sp.]
MSAVIEVKDTALDIGIDTECPICNRNRNPITGNPRFNAETLAAFKETKAIMRGEISVKKHKPHEFEEVWKELLED